MGGRGRTGTVIGVALVGLGHDPDAVIEYLHRLAVGRGRRGWPESTWQAEVVRSRASGPASWVDGQMPGAAPKNLALPNE